MVVCMKVVRVEVFSARKREASTEAVWPAVAVVVTYAASAECRLDLLLPGRPLLLGQACFGPCGFGVSHVVPF